MTKEEAEKAGIPAEERRFYFRVDKGEKDNMRPPLERAELFKLVGVNLDNGTEDASADNVGVVTKWEMPNALDEVTVSDLLRVQKRIAEGEWRESSQASAWAGKAIAEVLGIDASQKDGKAKIASILKTWIFNGALKIVSRKDEKRTLKTVRGGGYSS